MISSTLYAEYIKERQGINIIEDEYGFITWQPRKDECFIVDMYVRPDYRKQKCGQRLLSRLVNEVKNSAKVMTANIWLWDPNCNGTLQASLASGFTLGGTGDGFIRIVMHLGKDK